MKGNAKLVLAVVLGIVGTTIRAADYNGDLIIGFTAEIGNDFEYDLGPASSITNGQTWNLSAPLASFELATVKWGVIGSDANTGYAYATKASGVPMTLNEALWARQDLAVASIYSLFPQAGAGQSVSAPSILANSWYQQTIAGPLSTTYRNSYLDPNIAGLASIKFYSTFLDNSPPTQLGTFALGANGVVTFTAVSTAPAAPMLSIGRVGDVSSISFPSANGAIYTLYYTNSAGLTTPVGTWPALVGTITGDGTTKSFTNSTADADRFYRVKAQ